MQRPRILALGKVFLLVMPLIVVSATVRADEFRPIPAGDSHIKFPSKHFAGTTPKTFRSEIRHGFREYSTYSKGQTRAEIFHIRVTSNRYFRALETPKENITAWNYFNDKEITWDISGKKGGASIGLIRYQKFLLGSEKRECVSFTSAWGTSHGGKAGKTRKMEGYFCKPIGESLSAEEILSLTGNIRITEQVQSSAAIASENFNGKWVFEIREASNRSNSDKSVIEIKDGRFSVEVSFYGWRGTVTGEIDSSGNLAGTTNLKKMRYGGRQAPFETSYLNGEFHAKAAGKASWMPASFMIDLTRAAALSEAECLATECEEKDEQTPGSSPNNQANLQELDGANGALTQSPESQVAPAPAEERQVAPPELHDESQAAIKGQHAAVVAKATPEPAGNFDGEWVLEVREPSYMPSGDKVTVNVVDGRFTANVSANGWRGSVSGRIDRSGIFVASGYLRKPSKPAALLKWSSEPSGNRYNAKIPASTQWLSMTFEVSLYR